MAPKRASTKRAREAGDAPSAAAPAPAAAEVTTGSSPKKSRACSKQPSKFEPIVQAMEAADLPDDCRAMLISMVPGCLETPSNERQPLQVVAVSMINEAFQARQTAMEQAISDAEAKLAEFEAGGSSLEEKVTKAEQELAERVAVVEARKKVLATTSQEVLATKSAAQEALQAQRQHDEEVGRYAGEKTTLEAVLRDHFTPLKEGTWETTCGVHMSALLPLAKRIDLDQSLVSAMPSSCAKKPAERGPFDQMVVTQLEELLVQKVAAFAAKEEAAGPTATEKRLAAEAAQKNADAAKERQQQAASDVFSAQATQREQTAVRDEAKSSVDNFEPNLKAATEAIKQKKLSLEEFRSRNLLCFETLRDASTEPVVSACTPEASEDAPAALELPASEAKIPENEQPMVQQVAVGGQ